MFRVNSTSKQLVRLNVIEAGRPQLVDLLPGNFVFTESVTPQLKLMETEGVIKVREVRSAGVAVQSGNVTGKLDFSGDKVAKVSKKKKN